MIIIDVTLGPLNLILDRRGGSGNATLTAWYSGESDVYLWTSGPSHHFEFIHISIMVKDLFPLTYRRSPVIDSLPSNLVSGSLEGGFRCASVTLAYGVSFLLFVFLCSLLWTKSSRIFPSLLIQGEEIY